MLPIANLALIRRIEIACLKAWPSLESITHDGSVYRFSEGYSKRSNSVTTVDPSVTAAQGIYDDANSQAREDTSIAYAERVYESRNLPPIFRITHLSAPELDGQLEFRGYEKVDECQVMVLSSWPLHQSSRSTTTTQKVSVDMTSNHSEWLRAYTNLSNPSRKQHDLHEDILGKIDERKRGFASLVVDGGVVALGLGVVEDGMVGLLSILVDERFRGRGLGTAICSGILDWGRKVIESDVPVDGQQEDIKREVDGNRVNDLVRDGNSEGARGIRSVKAWLHVVESNQSARRIYERLGFYDLYPYHFRRRMQVA